MRPCEDVLVLISAALDGELSVEESQELQAHLDACPTCSALYRELSGLHQAARELAEEAPEEFSQRLLKRIAQDSSQETGRVTSLYTKQRRRWQNWAACAAVVTLVVLGAVQLSLIEGCGGGVPGAATADAGDSTASNPFSQADSLGENAPQVETAGSDRERGLEAFQEDTIGMLPEEENCETASVQDNGGKVADEAGEGDIDEGKPSCIPYGVAEDPQSAEQLDPTPIPEPSTDPESVAYCGILVITGEPLPVGLEEYPSSVNSVGELEYVVPAEYYYANAAALEDACASNYRKEETQDPDVPWGLIIVSTAED